MALIMLVDDEAEIVNLLSVILELYGYDVVGYTDAKVALEAAGRKRPDLMLVDLLMPGMDGLQFVSCCDQVPEVAGTPVLLLTGLTPSDETTRQMLRGPGMGMLEKPCDPDRIVHEVRRMLQEALAPDFRERARSARQGVLTCPITDHPGAAA